MMHTRRVILILSTLMVTSTCIDYCGICKGRTHTLCMYKEGPSENCLDYKRPVLSADVKKQILDIHNDIREHIASGQETRGVLGNQPAASNMISLQWDNELAEFAQRWADQCRDLDDVRQHDECRKSARFDVGQNVLTAISKTANVPEIAILLLNWYKQVDDVMPSDIEHFSGIQRGKFLIGQYTQLVWADTTFVGCGMSTFRSNKQNENQGKYFHRLVCNYGPRGNIIGTSVYQRGVPCSKCPNGRCDTTRTSLCKGHGELYTQTDSYEYIENEMASIFQPITLRYLLKNNLTKLTDNEEIKVKIYQKSEEISNWLIVMEKIKNEMMKHDIMKNSIDKVHPRMLDLLTYGASFKDLYELEDGIVVVHDCKNQVQQCQVEDIKPYMIKPKSNYIELPNNMIYRRVDGLWFHGKCRCDYVYRSRAERFMLATLSILFHFIVSIINISKE